MVDQTLAAFGRIACWSATPRPTRSMARPTPSADEAFDKIMGTNVKGTFWLCNMVIPHMVEQGGGSIVLLSSIAGLRASANIGVYGMSKAAEAGRPATCRWSGARRASASTASHRA
ncbi:SDR family oxidoreductase [Halopseudomonas pachastrellae]|nr:SDR family oxidoreductase [Halopseudomonas pachastrellae]